VNTAIPFVGDIFSQLQVAANTRVLAEIRDGEIKGVTGSELLDLVRKARTFIASKGLKKGDRSGLLAPNSIRWVALDLALMAEGLIVVPLYSRQAPLELVAMMKDCTPALLCCGDAALRDGILQNWPEAPPQFLFDEIFRGVDEVQLERPQVGKEDPVTIIYTSGTSGEAKGVVLTAASVGFMLDRTAQRLDGFIVRRGGARSHLPLFAFYVRGIVDCAADVSEAAKPGHDQHGFGEDRE
jgi:long-chain acyl-CoA synthetase